jgi:hypothetical protein
LTAPSTRKKIQNGQETGKHETHQAAVFVAHQTDRRGAICFLVYVAMADFFFLALTLNDLSSTVLVVQQQERESTTQTVNPKPQDKNRCLLCCCRTSFHESSDLGVRQSLNIS